MFRTKFKSDTFLEILKAKIWSKRPPFMYILIATMVVAGFLSKSYATVENTQNKIDKKPAQVVSIIQLVEHPALNATRQGILDTLKAAKVNLVIETEFAQGNPALASQIAQKFVSQKPDIMVGIPTTVSQALVAANKKTQIPIVFTSVTDPVGSGLVKNINKPEGNVTGVSNFVSSTDQFEYFKKVLPNLKTIGVIYNPGEANSVVLVQEMSKIAPKLGLKIVFASANSTSQVPDAARKLVDEVDAIFINNDNTALSAMDAIVKVATDNKKPVLSSDTDTVQRGVLVALGPNQYEIGKQTGKMILEILNGQSISSTPVQFPLQTETFLNQKKANELGIVFPKFVLEKANKVIDK